MAAEQTARERWLLAGQRLLRTSGIAAVKLDALCSATGLTTGSFYHHFEAMGPYRDELARYFGVEQIEAALAAIGDAEPRDRLVELARRSQDDDMGALYRAMRTWAAASPAAERAVRDADHRMLVFLETAFADLGADEGSARTSAVLFMSMGVATLHLPWDLPPDVGDRVLTLLAPPR